MNNKVNLFSMLPKVDELLSDNRINNLMGKIPREYVVEAIREELDIIRRGIRNGEYNVNTLKKETEKLPLYIVNRATNKARPKLKRVVNATGVVIHTNLGRSLISRSVLNNVVEVASNYSNLEFDLDKGIRGSRYSHIEEIIIRITGAESALVVNNNAAAVMLVLSTLAKDKEVIVSRGELVEIGGSFRVPDVMEQSGAKLVDVGTTNKTHLWDYENAINEDTAALLKVHTSNYRILGFTSSVELDELIKLGEKYNIPVIEDLGSGVLVDLSKYGLCYEPTVQDSIKKGADVVTFSGDKLLGGPQAGIIVGKKIYIDRMKKNPLTRAFRVDKFTLAALEPTLSLYLNENEAIKKIPTLNMITMSNDELNEKAKILFDKIKTNIDDRLEIKIVDQFSQVGGGSLPLEKLPTKALEISSYLIGASELEKSLRMYETPIISRIYKDKLYLDVRTIGEDEFDIIVNALKAIADNL
ncbi:L-seryl-tRNA(Sec) selenium transferase [Caloranaerobacter azorensis]|uniref:L-seryl-tRNA(Sec) selenium transferase n=1 Tax=Caloranaerobacter azorensis TaxID=116090 RepID=A0A6P1YBC3_9FIRM|nr:L-seryl-tRNA(Sec) selenium transferase [Caloranaerobacter azorensis]QIB26640.1 L-seryl-tRNA(Sec) selenium transferase [Caloranaerobacter azorensis]